jgi:type 1 glutamine amidotransferase
MYTLWLLTILLTIGCQNQQQKETKDDEIIKMKALIIDGESSHGIWPKTTMMMKSYLEETGIFKVDIARKKYTWQGPHHNVDEPKEITDLLSLYPIPFQEKTVSVAEPKIDLEFSPDFSKYDVVISNLGWKATSWPNEIEINFINYIKNGGGLVVIHGANNAFGDWPAYNEMIGLGGWGGRDAKAGPYVYYDSKDEIKRDTSEGPCGFHGPQHEFQVATRNENHPIMQGLPEEWKHTKDELYERLRGPAKNMTILATSFSDLEQNAPLRDDSVQVTNRHEPMLMTINFGKGRVFHSTLGHMDYSMECVGFITTFQRGAEWAATGKVTQPVPIDFPTRENTSSRKWKK